MKIQFGMPGKFKTFRPDGAFYRRHCARLQRGRRYATLKSLDKLASYKEVAPMGLFISSLVRGYKEVVATRL